MVLHGGLDGRAVLSRTGPGGVPDVHVADKDAAISAAWKEDEDKRAYWKLERDRIGTLERNCITLAPGGVPDVHVATLINELVQPGRAVIPIPGRQQGARWTR